MIVAKKTQQKPDNTPRRPGERRWSTLPEIQPKPDTAVLGEHCCSKADHGGGSRAEEEINK